MSRPPLDRPPSAGDDGPPPTSHRHRHFRLLVRLFPGEFRRQLGDDLVRLLAERAAEEHGRGPIAALGFHLSTTLRLLRDALAERARPLRGALPLVPLPRPAAGPVRPSSLAPVLPRPESLMDSLHIDLRDAGRALRRSPGTTLVIMATLALAIGASTTVFGVVDGVLLSPLPYPDAERLVVLWETDVREERSRSNLSPANFLDSTADERIFAAAAASQSWGPTLTGAGEARRLVAARVSHEFFDTLGVHPEVGRPFGPEEDRPGAPGAVVLSHETWQVRLGGDPDVLGSEILLDDEPHTVLGIMPPGFRGPIRRDAEAWAPLALDKADPARGVKFLRAVARLRGGVTPARAQKHLDAVSARLQADHPETNTDLAFWAAPLHEEIVRDVDVQLRLMLGAILLVLLIATANVANLQLARASGRAGELALRGALGAGRGRLVRQLLVESLALSLAGGVGGLLLAWWGTRGLVSVAPASMPRLDQVGTDLRVLLFTLAVSLVVGVVFGILPALQSTGDRLTETLRSGGRQRGSGSRGGGVRRGLVVVQIAVAMVLIVGSGLLLKSLGRLLDERTGFASEAIVAGVGLGSAYDDVGAFVDFHDRLLARLRARPEVERAATLSIAPFSGNKLLAWIEIPGRRAEAEGGVAWIVGASDGLFETLDVPTRRGREFTAADVAGSTPVAVVNRTFADRYLDGLDPLGREITVGLTFDPQPPERPRRIVGVVDDMRLEGLDVEPGPQVFVPYRQYSTRFMYLVLRTDGEVDGLAPVLRQELQAIDPRVPLGSVATLDDWIGNSVESDRFYAVVLTSFGAVALALGAVGIAGVIAYAVTRRRREFGIRIALGARRADVLTLVMREGVLLTAAGLVVGIPLAAVLSGFLGGLLHEVTVLDPWVYGLTAGALALIALNAAFLPARRAARVDPMISLRQD